MTNHTTSLSRYSFIAFIAPLLIFTMSSIPAYAEKIKVLKSKGNQALIETSIQLEVGQTYELMTENISQDVDYKSSILSSRKNSLTLGGQFDLLRADTFQSNSFALQVRYGWNFSSLELGALLNVSSIDIGAGARTTALGGAYFDYNLVANRDPNKILYGPFALLGTGSRSNPETGGSSAELQTNIGGFISYFIGNTSTALRVEFYGIYQQVNTTVLQSSVTGAGARGLLIFYF